MMNNELANWQRDTAAESKAKWESAIKPYMWYLDMLPNIRLWVYDTHVWLVRPTINK